MNSLYNPKSRTKLSVSNAGVLQFGAWKFYTLTTAVTANVTTTTAPNGSLAKTTHATGAGSIFRSDGAKWQYLVNA